MDVELHLGKGTEWMSGDAHSVYGMSRREFVMLAGGSAMVLSTPAFADAAPTTAAAVEPTGEDSGMEEEASATLGFTLPPDDLAEVKKQLTDYPGPFAMARKIVLDNGTAPNMSVTAPID